MCCVIPKEDIPVQLPLLCYMLDMLRTYDVLYDVPLNLTQKCRDC